MIREVSFTTNGAAHVIANAVPVGRNPIRPQKSASKARDYAGPHTCWYVDVIPGNTREEYGWEIGWFLDGSHGDKVKLKPSSFGDVYNDGFWERVSGAEVAPKLLEGYIQGGLVKVKEIIKSLV